MAVSDYLLGFGDLAKAAGQFGYQITDQKYQKLKEAEHTRMAVDLQAKFDSELTKLKTEVLDGKLDIENVNDRWVEKSREIYEQVAKGGSYTGIREDFKLVGERMINQYQDRVAQEQVAMTEQFAIRAVDDLFTQANELSLAGKVAESSALLNQAIQTGQEFQATYKTESQIKELKDNFTRQGIVHASYANSKGDMAYGHSELNKLGKAFGLRPDEIGIMQTQLSDLYDKETTALADTIHGELFDDYKDGRFSFQSLLYEIDNKNGRLYGRMETKPVVDLVEYWSRMSNNSNAGTDFISPEEKDFAEWFFSITVQDEKQFYEAAKSKLEEMKVSSALWDKYFVKYPYNKKTKITGTVFDMETLKLQVSRVTGYYPNVEPKGKQTKKQIQQKADYDSMLTGFNKLLESATYGLEDEEQKKLATQKVYSTLITKLEDKKFITAIKGVTDPGDNVKDFADNLRTLAEHDINFIENMVRYPTLTHEGASQTEALELYGQASSYYLLDFFNKQKIKPFGDNKSLYQPSGMQEFMKENKIIPLVAEGAGSYAVPVELAKKIFDEANDYMPKTMEEYWAEKGDYGKIDYGLGNEKTQFIFFRLPYKKNEKSPFVFKFHEKKPQEINPPKEKREIETDPTKMFSSTPQIKGVNK